MTAGESAPAFLKFQRFSGNLDERLLESAPPILLALLLLTFGIFVVITGGRAPLFSSVPWTEWRHAVAILTASVFSVFAIERLGYRLTVLIVLGFLVKVVEKQGWVLSLAFALSLSLGSFFLFYTILRVPLPEGPLGF